MLVSRPYSTWAKALSPLLYTLALCAGASSATAAEPAVPDYVAVLGGYSFPSKALGTTGSGATLSGIYGRPLTEHWGLEINLQTSTFETGRSGGTDFYQNGATADAVYMPWARRADRFTPFALVGIGGVYDDFYPSSRAGAAAIANAGAGVVSPMLFGGRLRLRLEARYVRDFHEGGHPERRVIAGIDIPLGRTPAP
jgi:OOP family OmpA-OmpF porin